jgi:dienelactone hydrolase
MTVGAIYLAGMRAAAELVHVLETDHLSDQVAAYDWLRAQDFIDANRIAVAGQCYGGIEVVLGAERVKYCAAIDAADAAESWRVALPLQSRMIAAVRNSDLWRSHLAWCGSL